MRACCIMLPRRAGLRSGDAQQQQPPAGAAKPAPTTVVASHRGAATVAVPPPPAKPAPAPVPKAVSEEVSYENVMRPLLFDEAPLAQTHAFRAEVRCAERLAQHRAATTHARWRASRARFADADRAVPAS
jgi:hypothetical protein